MDDDDNLPGSSAEAVRAAREAPGPGESDEAAADDTPAGGGGEQADEGSSPDEAAAAEEDAPALEEEGSSPDEPEPEASDADEDWTPEERQTREQYKNERELVKALRYTKEHSLGQKKTIDELQSKLVEAQGKRADPEKRDLPADRETPTADVDDTGDLPAPLPNEPPRLQQARRDLEAMANEFDAELKVYKEGNVTIRATARELIKVEGRIEGLEEELKAAAAASDDVRQQEIRQSLQTLNIRKDNLDGKITKLETDRTRRFIELKDLHRDHKELKGRTLNAIGSLRASERAKAKEREDFNEQEKVERGNVDAALTATMRELAIPKEEQKEFGRTLVIAANGHPGDIKDLKTFFVERGRFFLKTFGHAKARGTQSYADLKRRDASQPAPRGPAATAAAAKDRMPSSKEAAKAAREAMRRIPIGQ